MITAQQKTEAQKEALENHLSCVNNRNLKLYQYIANDKRKTTPKFFIQNGKSTISPALNYNDMNHFILGMSRANQILRTI
jgi:hypothetical protein